MLCTWWQGRRSRRRRVRPESSALATLSSASLHASSAPACERRKLDAARTRRGRTSPSVHNANAHRCYFRVRPRGRPLPQWPHLGTWPLACGSRHGRSGGTNVLSRATSSKAHHGAATSAVPSVNSRVLTASSPLNAYSAPQARSDRLVPKRPDRDRGPAETLLTALARGCAADRRNECRLPPFGQPRRHVQSDRCAAQPRHTS